MQTGKLEQNLMATLHKELKYDPVQVTEEEIREMKGQLEKFVVAPVDKHGGDAAVM